jgi:hypothetical protein
VLKQCCRLHGKLEIEETVEKAANSTSERQKANNDKNSSEVSAEIKALTDAYKAQHNKSEEPDKVKRALDVATVVLLFATALFTALAWLVFKGQLKAMRSTDEAIHNQLTLMESDQRPWVSAKAEISDDIHFYPTGARIPVRFILKNSGHSPALYVMLYKKVLVTLNGALIDGKIIPQSDPIAEMRSFCADNAGRDMAYRGIDKVFGETIFPSDNLDKEERDDPGRISAIDIGVGQSRSPGKIIRPYLIFCINYFFSGRPEIHQTMGLFDIYRIDQLHNPDTSIKDST